MAAMKARVCPICKKKDIKYLSAHLRNKHKLTTSEKRAPYLKKSLKQDNDEAAVKREDTVCTADEAADYERREQERALSDSFHDIEDHIVAIRLKAMQVGYDAPSLQRVRMEVRDKLMPLYDMIVGSLVSSAPPPAQYKRKNEEELNDVTPKRKKSRKRKEPTVSYSTAGMDFLENGHVRCQECRMVWDAKTSCICLCGITYNGHDREQLIAAPRNEVLEILDNGLVRCQACLFEWDGHAQHDCAYDEKL